MVVILRLSNAYAIRGESAGTSKKFKRIYIKIKEIVKSIVKNAYSLTYVLLTIDLILVLGGSVMLEKRDSSIMRLPQVTIRNIIVGENESNERISTPYVIIMVKN